MAQALFDEHPLEEYLRGVLVHRSNAPPDLHVDVIDAGESSITIPGISSELECELDPNHSDFHDDASDDTMLDWLPQYIIEFLEV